MAGSFGSGGAGEDDYVSGINVTPLVDVVLVLLVIFLMTAPVIYQSAIRVELPKTVSGEKRPKDSPLAFTITQDGKVLWNDAPVDWNTLAEKVAQEVRENPEQTALIHADRGVEHGVVVQLMDALRQAGMHRFALSVESSSPSGP